MHNLFYLGLIGFLVSCHSAAAREWVDRTGKYTTVADFVKVEDGKAVLKTSEGRSIRVPLDRLSKKDQEFIRQLAEEGSDVTSDDSSGEKNPDPIELPKGTLFGEDFAAVVVKMQGDQISFASDEEFIPTKSISLFLFSGNKKLGGQKFIVRPNGRGQSPHVHLRSKKPSKMDIVMNGYTMKLTFGPQQGKTVRGQIDLKIPKHKTALSGTFVIEEPKDYKLPPTDDDAPFIVANLKTPRSATEEDYVTAGYVGVTVDGKQISNMAGTSWSDTGHVSSLTHKPRVTSVIMQRRGVTAQHVRLEPGTIFHYFTWNHSYLVGEFVDVQADSQVRVSLEFDPNDAGSLEVETTGEEDVRIVPFELSEKSEELKSSARSLAFQLGLTAEPEDGKATFNRVRAGKYVVIANENEQLVEIRPGRSAVVKFEGDDL